MHPKGKARNHYYFGVKVSLAVTHRQGLMVSARSFPGNPYDGHVLSAQVEQTTNLPRYTGGAPRQVEPMIGQTKSDHQMDRRWRQGAVGDALHALSCAAGYNIRSLPRATALSLENEILHSAAANRYTFATALSPRFVNAKNLHVGLPLIMLNHQR